VEVKRATKLKKLNYSSAPIKLISKCNKLLSKFAKLHYEDNFFYSLGTVGFSGRHRMPAHKYDFQI
jgi:hypothetical protein